MQRFRKANCHSQNCFMKNIYLLFNIFFVVLITGCSKSKDESEIKLENLPKKVQEEIKANIKDCNTCGLSVKSCEFRGEKIYELYLNSPLCNGIILYYDTKGTEHHVTPDIFSEYMETRQVIETIWSCNP